MKPQPEPTRTPRYALPRALFVLLLLPLGAASCRNSEPPHLPAAPDPIVERNAEGEYLIRWDRVPEAMPVKVYRGNSPDTIDRSTPVAEMSTTQLILPAADPTVRSFFEIDSKHGRRIIAERQILLDGVVNFRDLGGYRTTNGSYTRWGMIYRSEKLSELSDADLATLQRLGLSLVCDFRGPTEREGAPDRLPEGVQYAAMRIISDEDFPDATNIRGIVTSGELANFDLAQLLIDMNRAFVEKYPQRYRELFDRLGSPESYPLLMHCSAGKDRTGFAAAMILSALGVPRETIMEDFLLTNHYAAEKVQKQAWKIRIFSLFRVDPEDLMPVLTVKPRYLEVAFEAIDEQYGSTERFLREAIGLSDEEIAALRDRLLRPPL